LFGVVFVQGEGHGLKQNKLPYWQAWAV